MKKIISKFLLGTVIFLTLIPVSISAEVKKDNFEETIADEIEVFKDVDGYEADVNKLKSVDLSNYKENEDKINVYIFRGSSCGYCLKSVIYFSSIVEKYGKYFNLYTYEVWNNKDNNDLMNEVGDLLGDNITGVPYIVIGDKSFPGYAESMNSDIISAIKDEYNSKDRYDAIEELKNPTKSNSNLSLDYLLFGVAAIIGLVVYINIKYNKIKKELNDLKDKIKKNKNN